MRALVLLALTMLVSALPIDSDARTRRYRTDRVLIADDIDARAFALDGGFVYWADRSRRLRRARIDDDALQDEEVVDWTADIHGLSVNQDQVYWSDDSGYVRKARFDGDRLVGQKMLGRSLDALDLAVEGSLIFWMDDRERFRVGRLIGDDIRSRHSLPLGFQPRAFTIGGGRIYLVDHRGWVAEATVVQRRITLTYINKHEDPLDIDVDRGTLYWLDQQGRLYRGIHRVEID